MTRTAVLGRVVAELDSRRDGVLPMHPAGVAETFTDERMARALTTARRKDRLLMAAMAGRASAADAGAVRMGRRLEEAARARTYEAA